MPTLLAGQGSNLQPPDSKSGVLPVELPAIGCWTHASALSRQSLVSFDVSALGTGNYDIAISDCLATTVVVHGPSR